MGKGINSSEEGEAEILVLSNDLIKILDYRSTLTCAKCLNFKAAWDDTLCFLAIFHFIQ